MMNDVSVREAFFNLGKAMRTYVLTIFLGGLLTIIVSVGSIMSLVDSIYSDNMPSFSLLLLPLIFIFLYIVAVFVLYCLFLSNLGKVSKLTGIPQLQKAYTYYLWAFLSGFIVVGVIFLLFFGLFASTLNSIFSDYSGSSDSLMGMFMGSFMIYVILIVVAVLVPTILKIIGVLAFSDWAVYSHQSNSLSPFIRQVKEGSDLMKWGTILSIVPFVSSIAELLELIGFFQVGSNLMKEYGPQTNPNPVQFQSYGSPPQDYQQTQRISSNYSPYPSSIPTSSPTQTTKIRFCPHCGGNLENLGGNPRFCPSCGRNL